MRVLRQVDERVVVQQVDPRLGVLDGLDLGVVERVLRPEAAHVLHPVGREQLWRRLRPPPRERASVDVHVRAKLGRVVDRFVGVVAFGQHVDAVAEAEEVARVRVPVRRVQVAAPLLRSEPLRDGRAEHVAESADTVGRVGQQEGLHRVVERRLQRLDELLPARCDRRLVEAAVGACLPREQVLAGSRLGQAVLLRVDRHEGGVVLHRHLEHQGGALVVLREAERAAKLDQLHGAAALKLERREGRRIDGHLAALLGEGRTKCRAQSEPVLWEHLAHDEPAAVLELEQRLPDDPRLGAVHLLGALRLGRRLDAAEDVHEPGATRDEASHLGPRRGNDILEEEQVMLGGKEVVDGRQEGLPGRAAVLDVELDARRALARREVLAGCARDEDLELARRRVGNRALAAEASRRHGCACLPLARRRPLRQLNHVAEDGHAREIASDVRLLERLLLAAHFVPHLQVHAFGRERLGGDGQGDRRRVGAGADRLQVHRGETTRLARLLQRLPQQRQQLPRLLLDTERHVEVEGRVEVRLHASLDEVPAQRELLALGRVARHLGLLEHLRRRVGPEHLHLLALLLPLRLGQARRLGARRLGLAALASALASAEKAAEGDASEE
mmetsp:Transcript_16034/g.52233  ORF Transcript_16034/g.52233 Transcript_16034/m.52233 type:complete len:615 (+) Transcript_16034:797-2641(+)